MLYLKAYSYCTETFRKKLDGSCVSSAFLGNNRQQMPVCAVISPWGNLRFFKDFKGMSPFTVRSAVVSAAVAAAIFLLSILQPEFLPQPDTIFQHTSLLQIDTRIPNSMPPGPY